MNEPYLKLILCTTVVISSHFGVRLPNQHKIVVVFVIVVLVVVVVVIVVVLAVVFVVFKLSFIGY